MDRLIIKAFARDVLGCGCSDEVFSHIESEKDIFIEGGLRIAERINIGNRLLIYVVNPADSFSRDEIEGIFRAGVEDRDRGNFNRFRLALAAESGTDYDAEELMATLPVTDDRMHVHIVEPAVLP